MANSRSSSRGRLFLAVLAALVLLAPGLPTAFEPRYHTDITREVLGETGMTRTIQGHVLRFSPSAVREIIRADVDQDNGFIQCVLGLPSGPFADSANHFDSEALTAASGRLVGRLQSAAAQLTKTRPDGAEARKSLGQILHGVQDYYAHTNWVDTQSGPDARLGSSVLSAVGPEIRTCGDPPNTGTYVPFAGLTSGYWFGCFGEGALPPGKCYHGSDRFPIVHAGTNHDSVGRPNFEAARDAAKETTRAIINKLLDWPGVAGDLKATAALMGAKTIAFVLDTTGSMSEEMPFVKISVEQIVTNADATGEAAEFVLVPFGDEVGEPFVTNSATEFLSQVDALTAVGGWDCPEMSATATLKGTSASLPGSTVYVYTDASAKDPATASAAIALAADRDTRIQPRLTGSCSPIDAAYQRMATETGGQLFFVQPSELPSLAAFSADLEPLMVVDDVFSTEPRTVAVPVDLTIERVVFSVSADTLTTMSVLRPDGSTVSAGQPGVSIMLQASGGIVAVEAPGPGSWTVTVQGTGAYSLRVGGGTSLFFDEFKFALYIEQSGFYEMRGQPLANQAVTAVARVEGTASPLTFEAVAADGTTLMPLGLESGHPEAADGEHVGTFNTTTTPFRVLVRGVEAGLPFQRVLPELIRPQFVRVLAETLPDPLLTGTVSTFDFLVSNTGPEAVFDIVASDGRGFVTGVSPQTVTVAENSTAGVQVTVLPPGAAGNTTMHLTVSAVLHDQPEMANSAFVDLLVQPGPPPTLDNTYYLHQESSTVTLGFRQLKTTAADSPPLARTSGNLKGRSAHDGFFGLWDTDEGVPGLAGVIPAGSVVTVTQWMRKTTNWGSVFPRATIWSLCVATGDTPLTTAWAAYTFSCTTTEPVVVFGSDRVTVAPGYWLAVSPGNHNMEVQFQIEGTTDSTFVVPNPR